MRSAGHTEDLRLYLGIEGGGTRTVVLLEDSTGRLLRREEFRPANLRLLTEAQLSRHLLAIQKIFPQASAVAIGLAGARTEQDKARLRQAAGNVWPGVPIYATNDLETALMAAGGTDRSPRVLVLSGTGSCCFGRTPEGKAAKVGGWGHILGDKGSGFEIGLRALKAVVYYYDRDGVWPRLGERILRALLLNEPDDLIAWVQTAHKPEIAALAKEVFAAADEKDKIGRDILEGAAQSLAKDAAACARRLVRAGTSVSFVFAGSVLQKQSGFSRKVQKLIKQLWPKAVFISSDRESAWGAVELARQLAGKGHGSVAIKSAAKKVEASVPSSNQNRSLKNIVLSPTERRNPRSMVLDTMPVAHAISLMLEEDAQIPGAILEHSREIEQVIGWIVQSFRKGGRLFYVGAGTSGRLGVLDASECPPTFRTEPELVQGIIAGGQTALWTAVEGAEDDPSAGAKAVAFRNVGRRDVVVGIAASGRTPFVWGALQEARQRGARTVLLCFNPHLAPPSGEKPHRIIAIDVGPEILTGSTRLKSGTATKLVLNMFTTLAMVRTGKVLSNLMVDVKASNVKLKDRATRIVVELTKADYDGAREVLERMGWDVKKACKVIGTG
ncbi:MAG: N-acetylmuramic acid 6-phosphate etherase [Verrucomicrobiales bacterium]|nr:N-acetylmuramic acid 6-phosphate etherase [Verrucomicrobiales bacterium]